MNRKKHTCMNRQFSLMHTVRYDECNCDGVLTPTAVLRYLQEVAALDAEDAQLGGNGHWVVKRTNITFTSPMPVHTRIELKTYGIHFTRITALRGYDIYSVGEGGQPVISARTLWVYIDPNGRPTRLPENTARIWLADGPLPQQPETPFPAIPETIPDTSEAIVQFSAIDRMRHLNNAAAVEMLDNASWQSYAKSGLLPNTTMLDALSYDIEYINSPRFGDHLAIQSWLESPSAVGQECSRLQQITHDGKVMVKAFSRWLYRTKE